MIGGEAAEQAALARRHVEDDAHGERDPYGLGWVVDWLYGDAILPPTPLPHHPEPLPLPRRTPAVLMPAPAEPRTRRSRQLALL